MQRELLYFCLVTLLLISFIAPRTCLAQDKISILMVGSLAFIGGLEKTLGGEPLVNYDIVPARETADIKEKELPKMIRLYFPRTFDGMKNYDVIILTSPDWPVFTPKQDQWMYDAIRQGTGGINDGSVFSIVSGIAEAWSSSLTQKAFPNDAPAVTSKKAGEATSNFFKIIINRECPEPILTVFIPFGVEDVNCFGASRMVIHREGSMLLAWQAGNFQGIDKVDAMAAWNYEDGRTITNGGFMAHGWLGYPTTPEQNQYAPEIIMNMLLWVSQRGLIENVEVFHRIKSNFHEYRSRMTVLVSLRDFIDRFGANTKVIDTELIELGDMYSKASRKYLEQDFVECENMLREGFEHFSKAEDVARQEKEAALIWVYITEWLVFSSTMFISGFAVWTLMVRRRLYKETKSTRLVPDN